MAIAEIEASGGGGDISITKLFDNTGTTAIAVSLSDSITNYSAIVVESAYLPEVNTIIGSAIIPTDAITLNTTLFYIDGGKNDRWVSFKFATNTSISIVEQLSAYDNIRRVWGIK